MFKATKPVKSKMRIKTEWSMKMQSIAQDSNNTLMTKVSKVVRQTQYLTSQETQDT
jgi:hypothetical protein